MTKNTSSCVLQPSESQVRGGPTTICFFFFLLSLHLQPPTRCPQSASIYSSMPLIREKRQQKRQFSKEGKRDRGCVVWSAWKFTRHWFPLCPSLPHAAVCCLKDWKRKHRPAGPLIKPISEQRRGARGRETPEPRRSAVPHTCWRICNTIDHRVWMVSGQQESKHTKTCWV